MRTRITVRAAIAAAMLATLILTLLAVPATLAQGGVTVVTGTVTIDGNPAPAGTTVEAVFNNAAIGTTTTGREGFQPNQYRIDITAAGNLENQVITLRIPGQTTPTPATFTFSANRVFTVNIAAARPAPTATPVPPTATPVPPTATPVPPTATPVSPTATPAPTATPVPPTATPRPTNTPTPPTATPVPPTATPVPPTPTPEKKGGGGCSAAREATGTVDAGWLALGLVVPGLAFAKWRRRSRRDDD